MSDWRYDPQRLALREQCLSILLKKYGTDLDEKGAPKYSMKGIYECCDVWVSQGNARPDGIVKYYEAYYSQ
tara:strand:- start:832 stop:1044 length:213 start_codon:yes stop_codon:yes gene_type:complete